MSVYTSLSATEVVELLARFELGQLVEYRGITAGIENTNYFVTTDQEQLVLTLFEHHPAAEVEQFVAFARHLGDTGPVPVPCPLADRSGQWLHEMAGKPAIICHRLPGDHVERPALAHCHAIGAALAQLHLAGTSLLLERPNNRGYDWWLQMPAQVSSQISADEQALLADELAHQQAIRSEWLQLPHGWIHGDMFHDNALFDQQGEQPVLGAILDLYNACQDAWIYDLAITANDWCCEKTGEWRVAEREALLAGYQSVRPFNALEQAHWHNALRAAALRFWLSRLLTRQHQAQQLQPGNSGQMAISKDPAELRHKLQLRRQDSRD
ncbi:homoserine kinase [Parathalassolituus penaei]|uniref:Homoserine kinase n=1 Tax=Parathalassolituus penaei TaxID=2997323 RepID=A0A9X3EF90_9GAMM|nr:homoserine kinase [Parathalassolituus penaei]MCY0965674.1 homoserine kinase [Parathalassolituus penaei]